MTQPVSPLEDGVNAYPFCGGEARFDGMEMQVQCRMPGCTGQSWMFDTMNEAIAAWSTRATLDPTGEKA